jgi:hypothetical protein
MDVFWHWLIGGVTHPVQYLVLGTLATVLFAVAKAGFGGGLGLLSVPLMIYACAGDARQALGIMLPLLIAGDYVAFIAWWRKWNLRAVLMLLPGAVAGTALAWLVMWGFARLGGHGGPEQKVRADAAVMASVGVITIAFVALHVVRSLRAKPLPFRPVAWQSTLVGTVSGYTSMTAHAAGPVITMYLLPQQLPRTEFVASTVLYFWIGNQIKIGPYLALGMVNRDVIGPALVLVPAAIVGTFLGLFLHDRVNQKQFANVVYALLTLAGADLLRHAVMTLWFS